VTGSLFGSWSEHAPRCAPHFFSREIRAWSFTAVILASLGMNALPLAALALLLDHFVLHVGLVADSLLIAQYVYAALLARLSGGQELGSCSGRWLIGSTCCIAALVLYYSGLAGV
ncbi:unnamed protein product, partial [Polarella glacialis]